MNDTQFDDFFNDTFKDHAVPVPAGLWDKVAEGQLDQFIGGKLRDADAPVPDGLWDKITDTQFDSFVAGTLSGAFAPVPSGVWDKITDGQFDAFVAGKLTDHEAPIPAGLWEKVKPEEDNDRVGFIWFRYPAAAVLILGILAAGAIGGYFYFKNQPENNTTVTNTPPASKGNGTDNAKETTQPAITDKVLPTNDNTAGIITSGNDVSSPAAPAKVPEASVTNSNGRNDERAIANGLTNSNRNNSPIKESLSANGYSEASVSASNRKKGLDLKPVDTKNNTDLSRSSYDIFNKDNASNDVADGMDEINAYQQRNLLNGTTISSGLNGFSLSQTLLDKQLSTMNHTNQFRNIIICPADNKRNTDWYIEAYASPEMPFKSVSNVSATPLYLLKKDSSESMQVSYSAGLRLVKPITDNILVKAGVQYSQANEKYVYRTENEVKTTTVVTVRTIIRAPGDTVIVQDTSVLQTIGFRNNTVKNRYRSFDIPVTVGYQFGNDDLKIGINAGVAINLSSWYEGVILDSSLAIVTLNKTGNPVYKSNIGLGLIAGVSVIKRLSDDMHVFFEPHVRYNLSNMTTNQASFKQKFSVGGLSIGLRINLNRK